MNVGDKVRVVNISPSDFDCPPPGYLGQVGKIVYYAEIDAGLICYPWTVEFDDGKQYDFESDELEVVSDQ